MILFKDKYRIESARLPGWDYASAGCYFVTICTQAREYFLGDVVAGEIRLSAVGELVCDFWQEIPGHTSGVVSLDAFVVMPNHLHGIIVINDFVREKAATGKAPTEADMTAPLGAPVRYTPFSRMSPRAGSLSAIVRSYKSAVTRWSGENGHRYFAWQARYFDHVIRDVASLKRIREYIVNNPAKWETDRNNKSNLWM